MPRAVWRMNSTPDVGMTPKNGGIGICTYTYNGAEISFHSIHKQTQSYQLTHGKVLSGIYIVRKQCIGAFPSKSHLL